MDECKSLATPMCQKEKLSKLDQVERVNESLTEVWWIVLCIV